jgi:ribosomal protein L9
LKFFEGHLFAKIDKEYIVKALKEQKGIEFSKNIINLEKPIKEVGEYQIKVEVNKENTTFKLNIVSEKEKKINGSHT